MCYCCTTEDRVQHHDIVASRVSCRTLYTKHGPNYWILAAYIYHKVLFVSGDKKKSLHCRIQGKDALANLKATKMYQSIKTNHTWKSTYKHLSKSKYPETTQEWKWNVNKMKTFKCQENGIKGGSCYILSTNAASTNLQALVKNRLHQRDQRQMTAHWLTDVRGGMKVGKTAFLFPILLQKPAASVACVLCRMLQLYLVHYTSGFCVCLVLKSAPLPHLPLTILIVPLLICPKCPSSRSESFV